MSLARLALRLATMEGLQPAGSLAADGPWPTLAGKYVFDSRIEPIEDLLPGEDRPIVCVYTEHDDGKAGQARGGPPFLLTVDLVFELSVIVKIASEGDPTTFVVGEPETDPELEASLDLLEAQIKFALLFGPTGEIWRHISKRRVHNPRSAAHRTSEEGVRLARRTVTWKVEVNDDCFDPVPTAVPTGNEILPHPLRYLASVLPANSHGAKIIAGLIAEPTAPVMPVATPLESVTLNVSVVNPSTDLPPSAPNIVGEVDNLQD